VCDHIGTQDITCNCKRSYFSDYSRSLVQSVGKCATTISQDYVRADDYMAKVTNCVFSAMFTGESYQTRLFTL
jgi:hypothetical protein